MRLTTMIGLPPEGQPLLSRLEELLLETAHQVNGISEGTNSAYHNGQATAPTTGTYAQGDFIRNLAPSEAGTAGSKYVVTGWICTVSGTPGTFLQVRALTGN